MARQDALPPTLAPRLIKHPAAAAYASVSVALFDEMVRDGRMPRPKQISPGRIGWDVRELDAAIDELPTVRDPTPVDDSWGDVDAKETADAR
ncbi:MAG: hypothetical protein GY788_05075 [bacterium]|nr:hypothetical protein [bacterium]